jgi:hypothetical protein
MKRMDVKRLSQLRYLKREIAIERDRVIELRALAGYGRRRLGCEGKASRTADRTGGYASEIAYLTDLIAQNMTRCICELLRVQSFINSIDDSELRIIFRERYIKGRSWLSIAFLLGYHDEQIPRRKHDRFLQKNGYVAVEKTAARPI